MFFIAQEWWNWKLFCKQRNKCVSPKRIISAKLNKKNFFWKSVKPFLQKSSIFCTNKSHWRKWLPVNEFWRRCKGTLIFTIADLKICQYFCFYMKTICWRFHIKTFLNFWDIRTWDIWKVCLQTFWNNRIS